MSGFDLDTRYAILDRCGGKCENCRTTLHDATGSIHHRRPRGMGGTRIPWVDSAPNGIALCGSGTTGCHGWFESHREDGYTRGILLRSGQIPDETPFIDRLGQWWLLVGTSKYRIMLPDAALTPVVPPRPPVRVG